MAAFQFPENPGNGDTTTNAATGLTYVYRYPPGKWEVLMTASASDFVNVTGDTMTGPLVMDPDAATSTGVVNIKISTTAADNFGLKIRDSSDASFFQAGGDKGVEYSGLYTESAHLATKANVDNAVTSLTSLIDATALTSGGTIIATGGSVDTSGNLTIKQSITDAQDGRLYLKHSDNTTNISLYGASGGIDMKGSLSFNSTSNSKNIRAYGSSSPVFNFLSGAEASSLVNRLAITTSIATFNTSLVVENNTVLKGDVNVNSELSVFSDINFTSGATQTINLAENTTIKVQPLVYGGGAQGNPTTGYFEIGVRDTSQAYVTFPYKIDLAGGYETNIEAPKIARMFLNSGSFYFYKGSGTGTSPASNILAIFNRNSNGMEAWAPILTKPYSGDTPGIVISAETNTNSTWNQPKAGQLKFATYSGSGNSNGNATGVLVGGGHTSPQFTFAMEPYGVTQYLIFSSNYSPTYGKRMYIYPDYDNPNLPDETPVNIKYLKENGLVTTSTYTSAAGLPDDSGDATTILTQTNASIPAQCEFQGRTTTGRGFTLTGCTQDQPLNTSAVCLRLMHNITSAAQLEYLGSTTASNECVQTKASVPALIQPRNNTWTGTNTFKNTVNLGNNNAFVITEAKGVLRLGPSAASGNAGLNNGAIQVIDSTGAITSGLYENGLYTKKKIVMDGTTGTQDLLLQGTTYRGLNIKHMTSTTESEVLFTIKHSGSVLNSPLSVSFYKITSVASPTAGADAANKSYVDTTTSNLQTAIHTAVNGSSDYASLKAALLAALA